MSLRYGQACRRHEIIPLTNLLRGTSDKCQGILLCSLCYTRIYLSLLSDNCEVTLALACFITDLTGSLPFVLAVVSNLIMFQA